MKNRATFQRPADATEELGFLGVGHFTERNKHINENVLSLNKSEEVPWMIGEIFQPNKKELQLAPRPLTGARMGPPL